MRQLSASVTAFASLMRNRPETVQRYGPETPEYAKLQRQTKPGVQVTLGVNGTF